MAIPKSTSNARRTSTKQARNSSCNYLQQQQEQEDPLLVQIHQALTNALVEDWCPVSNNLDGDASLDHSTTMSDPLFFSHQSTTVQPMQGQRIRCLVWNATVDESAMVMHSILVDRSHSGCYSDSSSSCKIGIQVGAGSIVEYCNLTVTARSKHTSPTASVSIGKYCVVSGYTLRKNESLVLPDSFVLQRVSLYAPAAAKADSAASSMLFFEDDDCLLVYKNEDVNNNTIFGHSVEACSDLLGLSPQDLWDSDDESDHTFHTARLFPVVDRKEIFESYYAWLQVLGTTSTATWTALQKDSLQRYKSAVRLSALELQESCGTALRAAMQSSRRALCSVHLPAIQTSLYKEVFQTSLLVLPERGNEAAVSLVVDSYCSSLAWIQQQQHLHEGQSQHHRSNLRTATTTRMCRSAMKTDVVSALRLLDDVIRMTEDETVTENVVQQQVSILQSLGRARRIDPIHMNSSNCNESDERIAKRARFMIADFVHDRDRFTAVRDFVLLEYSNCPDIFDILAEATQMLPPSPRQAQLQQPQLPKQKEESHNVLLPLSPLCRAAIAGESSGLTDDTLENEVYQYISQMSQVLSSSNKREMRLLSSALHRQATDARSVESIRQESGLSPSKTGILQNENGPESIISLAASCLRMKI